MMTFYLVRCQLQFASVLYDFMQMEHGLDQYQCNGLNWFILHTLQSTCFLPVEDLCAMKQGCPQDIQSQDRDETEAFHFFKISKTKTLNSQDRDETETFQKTSRHHSDAV